MRLLSFILLFSFSLAAQPPVYNPNFYISTTQVDNNVVDNMAALDTTSFDAFKKVTVLGYYTAGDGGGGDYFIEDSNYSGYVDSIHTRPLPNGNFARYLGDEISFKQYGIKSDVSSLLDISISGNIVTCSSCSFVAGDTGKVLYAQRLFDVGPKLEAHPKFDSKTYPNFASVPSSMAADSIVKVTNSSDYSNRDTLTGTHYFVYNTSHGWVAMLNLVDAVFEIDQVISATQIQINYTAPSALSNITARYGTSNARNWDKLKELVVNTGISVDIGKGDFAIRYHMGTGDSGIFYFDDGNASNIATRSFNMRGRGSESKLYFWYTTDTLGFVTDPTLPDNTFLGGFFNYVDPRPTAQYDICNIHLSNFDFEGVDYTGFRNVDGRNRNAFAFSTGKGDIILDNVNGRGGDGYAYNSGQRLVTIKNMGYDGRYTAETGIQVFGEAELIMENFNLYAIAPFNFYTVFSSNGRARPWYIHPERSFWINNGEVGNCAGLSQLFSGGGLDSKDSTSIHQTLSNVRFYWNDWSASNSNGFYTGRVGERMDMSKLSFTTYGLPTGSAGNTAITIAGDCNIDNCHFNRMGSITIGTNVGTNNVRLDGDSIATVNLTNVNFKQAGINLPNLPAPNPQYLVNIDGFNMVVDSTLNFAQFIRVQPIVGIHSKKVIANFRNGIIHGYLNGVSTVGLPNETPLFFPEEDAAASILFENVKFRLKTFSTGATQFLIKQLRSDVDITFNSCDVPATDTVYIDMDPSTPEPMIKGKDNFFPFVTVNGGTNYAHDMKLKVSVGDTLASASTVTIEGIHNNEYYISGSTQIETINFGIAGSAERLVNDDFYIVAIDGFTIGTSGNFSHAAPQIIPAGSRILIRHRSDTIENTILEVNE